MIFNDIVAADTHARRKSAQTLDKLLVTHHRDELTGEVFFHCREYFGDITGDYEVRSYYHRGNRYERRMIAGRPTNSWMIA